MGGAFTTRGRPIAQTLAEWRAGRAHGLKLAQIAADLGIKATSLERALYRARAKGLLSAGESVGRG